MQIFNMTNTKNLSQPKLQAPSRRALLFLFLTMLAILAYAAPRWNDWNQNSRLSLVRAIVDYGTVRIDNFQGEDQQSKTGDYAFYQGHYYSDKPPGPALVGILPYAVLKAGFKTPFGEKILVSLSNSAAFNRAFTEGANYGATSSNPQDKILGAFARIWLSILLVAVPSALLVCVFWKWVAEVTGHYWLSLVLSLALGFGTTFFPFSSLFFNHALTASLLFISFYILYRLKNQARVVWPLILVGFLLGFCLISQYETVLIAAALGLYALATVNKAAWLRRVLFLAIGGLPPLLAMVIYDYIAFGTPMPIGYQYSTLWLDKHSQGFMSLTYPHLAAIWGLTFSPYRGLFLLSPFLLLALPGFYLGLKKVQYRAETLVSLWSTVAFFLFNASSIMWWGGHSFGPRYLVSCLPFCALGVAFLLREAIKANWQWVKVVFVILAGVSIAIVLPASMVGRQWPSEEYNNPLTDYLWPQLFKGNFALNPGTAVGLKGLISYLPLLVVIGLFYLFIFRLPRGKTTKLEGKNQKWLQMSSTVELGSAQTLEPLDQSVTGGKVWWRRDWAFVTAILLGLLLFTSFPYIFGYLRETKDKAFMGIMLDVPDTTQYWSWMGEMQRSWVISNPLTSEPNDPVFFNLLWGVLGRLQAVSGLEPALIYQLLRLVSIVFFGWMVWLFCRMLFNRLFWQRLTFFLIMFGSGWGWILVAIKQVTGTLSNPLAVFVAEPNSFLSALAFPHLILSAGLLLAVFMLAIKAQESRQLRLAVAAGIIALVLGLEHTYDLIIVYSVLGGYWLYQWWYSKRINWRWFQISLIIGLLSSPPSLYFTYITMTNPTWKGVLAQYGNAGVFTPDPFNLLILIGPFLLLAFAGLWTKTAPRINSANSSEPPSLLQRWQFVKVWFVLGCGLIYLPTNFQIKMLNGWQVPIFILGIAGVESFLNSAWARPRKFLRRRWLVYSLLVAIALPTTLYLFSWRFLDLNRTNAPYYITRDELAAMAWLERQEPSPVIVLASEDLGQFLSPRSGQRPFLAHWAMTLDYYTKRDLVTKVFAPQTTVQERAAILQKYQVTYLLYGLAEKKLAPELQDSNLQKVFSSTNADVYKYTGGKA